MKIVVLIICIVINIFANEKVEFYNPSFSCEKVKQGSIEYKICTDENLANLDKELSKYYLGVKLINKDIKQSQRNWIKERNRCKDNKCMINNYSQRIKELQNIIKKSSKKFIMILNKDNDLCSNMLDIYNDKDELLKHKEFNTYTYNQTYSTYRTSSTSIREKRRSRYVRKGMTIDINNDGEKEILLRDCMVKFNVMVRLVCSWDIVPYKYHQNMIDGDMDTGVLYKDTIISMGFGYAYKTEIQDINKTSIELLEEYFKKIILEEQQKNQKRMELSIGVSENYFMPFRFKNKNYLSFNAGFVDISEMNKEYQSSTKCIFYKKGKIDGN